jgi:dTDP-D-glucose 4,6-dehydratase
VDRSIAGAAPFIETNIQGTFSLLEAARGYHAGLGGAARFPDRQFGSSLSHQEEASYCSSRMI